MQAIAISLANLHDLYISIDPLSLRFIASHSLFINMPRTFAVLHSLNAAIGCLCIVILGLTAHSIILKDQIDALLPKNIGATDISMLMWAGLGGIVDMTLLLCLLCVERSRKHTVCKITPLCIYDAN